MLPSTRAWPRAAIGLVSWVSISAPIKNSRNRVDDYACGIAAFADVADYFTINISSPNTPGLRDLQRAGALDDLLARVLAVRDKASEVFARRPVLLKIAPDLTLAELDEIVKCARSRQIDGLIVSNTTIARPASLNDPAAAEQGGLSGRPLFLPSTRMLAQAHLRVDNQFPLIGAGGVDSPETALAKIEAGASLVQFYSSLIFKGRGSLPRSTAALSTFSPKNPIPGSWMQPAPRRRIGPAKT